MIRKFVGDSFGLDIDAIPGNFRAEPAVVSRLMARIVNTACGCERVACNNVISIIPHIRDPLNAGFMQDKATK